MSIDPVCRMQVDENQAAAKSDYHGKQYYFCCEVCREKFERDPERYVKAMESSGQT